ncbi:MAG: ATP-binding cassette domain-containing protein [Polyangiaceae bacterium]|nr:ATP-binding cassette domain-containing protein [Polyangiaceae bacterium]
MTDVVLCARALRVALGGTEVLRGVDLNVGRGRISGVLGPSGAGKTTLFRVLVGELMPQAGSIALFGRDVSGTPLWKRARLGLGYVPQTPSVLTELSVHQNIRTFGRVAGVPADDTTLYAAAVGLSERLGVRAGDLSGGERKRLELLRALLGNPRLLVLDEPFAGLDPPAVRLVGTLLRETARDGCAVVLADHRVREALSVCDEARLLVDGVIAAEVPPEQFADHPAVRERYLQ